MFTLRCAVPKLHQEARKHGGHQQADGAACNNAPCGTQGGVFCCASRGSFRQWRSLSCPRVVAESEVSAWTLVVVVNTAYASLRGVVLTLRSGVCAWKRLAPRGNTPPHVKQSFNQIGEVARRERRCACTLAAPRFPRVRHHLPPCSPAHGFPLARNARADLASPRAVAPPPWLDDITAGSLTIQEAHHAH